jgi:serine/threonine protein kinase
MPRLLHEIRTCQYSVPAWVSSGAADLLNGLLRVNPHERLSCEQILAHPWMARARESAPLPRLNQIGPKLLDMAQGRVRRSVGGVFSLLEPIAHDEARTGDRVVFVARAAAQRQARTAGRMDKLSVVAIERGAQAQAPSSRKQPRPTDSAGRHMCDEPSREIETC